MVVVFLLYSGISKLSPISLVQLSHFRVFATHGLQHQASLSITNSQILLKFMPTKFVVSSNRLVLCHSLLLHLIFPSIRVFPVSQFFTLHGQSIGASASAPFFSMNIQVWFPSGWTGWLSLQSKGLSKVFNTTVQKHHFFGAQLCLWSNSHIYTWLLGKP